MKEIPKSPVGIMPVRLLRCKDATDIIVAMGSVTETIKSVVDYLNKQGRKTGCLVVHLYRPFSTKYLFNVLPKTVERVAVLDRTKEPGSIGEPLYLDVKALSTIKKMLRISSADVTAYPARIRLRPRLLRYSIIWLRKDMTVSPSVSTMT